MTSYNEQIRDEASEWLVRFSEGEVEASDCVEFDAWLRSSPEHVRAYLDMAALWQSAGSMKSPHGQALEELIERARLESNVVSLGGKDIRRHGPSALFRNHRLAAIAACGALIVLVSGGIFWWDMVRYPTYATGIGERHTVSLDDGSTIQLNGRSRVKVLFSKAVRAIDLQEGEALFKVAKNPARPFIVSIDSTRVKAVGTEFDVYRKSGETVVTVIEGRVSVSSPSRLDAIAPSDSNAPPVLLAAGEQASVLPRTAPSTRLADVSSTTAWTEGRLVFDSTPLADVVQEFNRYTHRPLQLDGAALAQFHVSGSFNSAEPGQLISFLKQRFGLTVRELPDGTHISLK